MKTALFGDLAPADIILDFSKALLNLLQLQIMLRLGEIISHCRSSSIWRRHTGRRVPIRCLRTIILAETAHILLKKHLFSVKIFGACLI